MPSNRPQLGGKNVATNVNQLNPPRIQMQPTTPSTALNPVKTPKLTPLPRFENALQPRPHTIEGVIRPRKQ
jgi:hypothetical protein